MFLKIIHVVETGVDDFATNSSDSCADKDEASEYCFVQNYEPIKEHQVSSDGIDKAFEFVKQQWYEKPEDSNTSSAAKTFRLFLASAIVSSIDILYQNVTAQVLNASEN